MSLDTRPKLAVYKFSSCDGCQLAILSLEDELLGLAGEVEIAYFLEARSQTLEGPYDVTLVEGSVTTAEDIERLHKVREQSKFLITIGACATAGGDSGPAQLGGRGRIRAGGLCHACLHQYAGTIHADLHARGRGFRTQWLPYQQVSASRSAHGFADGAHAPSFPPVGLH